MQQTYLFRFRHISARIVFLCMALILYAVFGSSTPDNPGMIELVIGGLLIFCVRFPRFLVAPLSNNQTSFELCLLGIVVWGLSIPLCVGVWSGHSALLIVRDLIALFFLCAPLFLYPLLKGSEYLYGVLKALIIFIGIAFSVRALLPVYEFVPVGDELLYLANSPLVLLSALLLIFDLFKAVLHNGIRRLPLHAYLCGALSIVPLAAMLIDVQRAPVSAVVLSIAAFVIFAILKYPRRIFIPISIIIVFGLIALPLWESVYTEIASKTARVGMNMRLEELRAVVDSISSSWFTILFGNGWGAEFYAPSVGGLSVGYTHSLLSYLLLKTGLVGLLMGVGLCACAMSLLYRFMQKDITLALALFWPFFIPVFLYASHKSFDFGLVLLFFLMTLRHVHSIRMRESQLPLGFNLGARYKIISV